MPNPRGIPDAEWERIVYGTGRWIYRVEVRRRTGTEWVNLSAYLGADWVTRISAPGDTPDQPADKFTVAFIRRHAGRTLAPGVHDEPLNIIPVDGHPLGMFRPFMFPRALIRVWVANVVKTDPDEAAVWREWLTGDMEDVDWPADEVVTTCNTQDGILERRQIEDEEEGGAEEPGVPREEEFQRILDRWDAGVELYCPVPLALNVLRYNREEGSIGAHLRALAHQVGADARWRWSDEHGTYRYTLYLPPRDKVDADYELPIAWEVPELRVSGTSVRNVFKIRARNAAGQIFTRRLEDGDSIAEYDRVYMGWEEDEQSNVKTTAAADAMLGYARNDVAQPLTTMRVRVPFNPFISMHDKVGIPAISGRYSFGTSWAVVTPSHEVSETDRSTMIDLREGSPVGQFYGWLARAARRPASPADDDYGVEAREVGRTETHVTIAWSTGARVAHVHRASLIIPQPHATDVEAALRALPPAAVHGPGPGQVAIPIPPRSNKLYVGFRGFGEGGIREGRMRVVEIDPLDPEPPLIEVDWRVLDTVATLWIHPRERGIAVAALEVVVQQGRDTVAPGSGWAPPPRDAGDDSAVRGGQLGAGEYEVDVERLATGLTSVWVRTTLETGEQPTAQYVVDRGIVPLIADLDVDQESRTVRGIGNDNVLSWRVTRVGVVDPWSEARDGYNLRLQVPVPDGETWELEVRAYSRPADDVDGATSYDQETRVVRGADAPSGPSWASLTVWPPLIDGVDVRIFAAANASAAEADPPLVATAWSRYWLDGSLPNDWVARTLTPALGAPLDEETSYTFAAPSHHERETSGSVLITYEVRLEMRTAGGDIVDAIARQASWRVELRPPPDPPPPE